VVDWTCKTCGELRNAFSILISKLEGKIPLGEPRCRWKNGVTLDFKEVGCEGVAGFNSLLKLS
jgi:hypothetical protein